MSLQNQYLNQNVNLEQIYVSLNEERNQLKREFQTLDSANENSQLTVTSNYYKFIVLLFVTILLFILLLKYSFTGQQIGGGNNFKREAFFLFSLMLICLLCGITLNMYDNSLVIFIVIIVYIITKIKLHQ
jgi:hypothetical protein